MDYQGIITYFRDNERNSEEDVMPGIIEEVENINPVRALWRMSRGVDGVWRIISLPQKINPKDIVRQPIKITRENIAEYKQYITYVFDLIRSLIITVKDITIFGDFTREWLFICYYNEWDYTAFESVELYIAKYGVLYMPTMCTILCNSHEEIENLYMALCYISQYNIDKSTGIINVISPFRFAIAPIMSCGIVGHKSEGCINTEACEKMTDIYKTYNCDIMQNIYMEFRFNKYRAPALNDNYNTLITANISLYMDDLYSYLSILTSQSGKIYAITNKQLMDYIHVNIKAREYITHPLIFNTNYQSLMFQNFNYKLNGCLLPFNYIEDNGECVICMEVEPNDILISLKCCTVNHCHHYKCIKKWSDILNRPSESEYSFLHCSICKKKYNLI